MLAFFKNMKLIYPLVQNSLLPAFIFGAALLGFYLYGEISTTTRTNLHILFWASNFACLSVLIYFNQRKPLLFLLMAVLSYIIIKTLKQKYSLDFLSTSSYINLCFFAPLNLCIFYFLPNKRLLSQQNLYWLIFIFAQYAVAEHLDNLNIAISINGRVDGVNLNSLSIILFLIFLIAAFIRCTMTGYISDSALFFSGLNIFAGFYYSASSTALSIFFAAAAFTACVAVIKDIRYAWNYDLLTGLWSRRSYMKHAQKFPLKYSLGLICVDNYPHLYKHLGMNKSQKLLKMLAQRLQELESECPIYRYGQDEFIIIFKNTAMKTGFERLDALRRDIASAEFLFSPKEKGLKITISGCISEKKRSDSNSTEVLQRARRTLEKTYQFTQNITSKA